MLSVFIHGGLRGQKSLKNIVIDHRDRVGVRKPFGWQDYICNLEQVFWDHIEDRLERAGLV